MKEINLSEDKAMGNVTEEMRRELVADINNGPHTKEEFDELGVKTWDTTELTREFEVIGFAAPFCIVREKLSGKKGSIMFQHSPRLYFNFEEA